MSVGSTVVVGWSLVFKGVMFLRKEKWKRSVFDLRP